LGQKKNDLALLTGVNLKFGALSSGAVLWSALLLSNRRSQPERQ
jgi:hypothetical protein